MATTEDVSDSLDAISQQEGDLLARGPELWEPITPDTAGYLLTDNGPGKQPSFQPPGLVATSPQGFTLYGATQTSTGAQATRGQLFVPRTSFNVSYVDALIDAASASDTFQAILAEVDAESATCEVVEVLGSPTDISAYDTSPRVYQLPLNEIVTLEEGKVYVIGASITSGTASTALRNLYADAGAILAPGRTSYLWCNYDTIGLTVGQQPDSSLNNAVRGFGLLG